MVNGNNKREHTVHDKVSRHIKYLDKTYKTTTKVKEKHIEFDISAICSPSHNCLDLFKSLDQNLIFIFNANNTYGGGGLRLTFLKCKELCEAGLETEVWPTETRKLHKWT